MSSRQQHQPVTGAGHGPASFGPRSRTPRREETPNIRLLPLPQRGLTVTHPALNACQGQQPSDGFTSTKKHQAASSHTGMSPPQTLLHPFNKCLMRLLGRGFPRRQGYSSSAPQLHSVIQTGEEGAGRGGPPKPSDDHMSHL